MVWYTSGRALTVSSIKSPRSRLGEVSVSPLRTVVQHRRIDVAAPDDVPDGTVVEVRVVSSPEVMGLTESQWDDSRSGTAHWFEWLDSLQPLALTESERLQLASDRDQQKRWELEQFSQHADQLKRDWE